MQSLRSPLAQGLFFGILWTVLMIWRAWPLAPAPIAILVVCGALAGVAFGWTMGKFFDWMERRNGAEK